MRKMSLPVEPFAICVNKRSEIIIGDYINKNNYPIHNFTGKIVKISNENQHNLALFSNLDEINRVLYDMIQ
jgi:hypothetical protein